MNATSHPAPALHRLGGQSRGPAALMCHGVGLHARLWSPVAKRLGGWRTWAVDFRNHGQATRSKDLAWTGLRDDVLRALNVMRQCEVIGIGHSAGATALVLAEVARPGSFVRLYLYEPILPRFAGVKPTEHDRGWAERAIRLPERFSSIAAAEDWHVAQRRYAAWDPEVLALHLRHGLVPEASGGVRLACLRQDEAALYAGAWQQAGHLALRHLKCPVVVAGGELSTVVTPAMLGNFANACVEGTASILPGLTHDGPWESPETVAASILKTCETGGGR